MNRQTRNHPEGAAMLVVMLVLLMMTGTAIIAMQSARYEMQTAGSFKRRHQATMVADAGLQATYSHVDQITPQGLVRMMQESTALNSGAQLDMTKFEAPLAPGKQVLRLYPEDFILYDDPSTTEIETFYENDLVGAHSALEPYYMVDLYDAHEYTGVLPGRRVDGRSKFKYLRVTYTSRGRMRVPTATGMTDVLSSIHEVSADARGYAVSGPFSL